jgi:hypothetical protein
MHLQQGGHNGIPIWIPWLSLTMGINLCAFSVFTATSYWCHFQPVGIPCQLIPIGWALVTFRYAHGTGRYVVVVVNGFLALAWVWLGWQFNLRFLVFGAAGWLSTHVPHPSAGFFR